MLSIAEIKRFIDDDINSEKKKNALIGQRYYEADHDIKNYRMFYINKDGKPVEDTTRANIKIPHPFFTELSDQLSAYMLSFDENPIRAKETENAAGLQDYLDLYFDEEFWAEISELITGTYNKGFEYIYAYKGAEGRTVFECADSMGVVEVRAKDTDDGCEYYIYWYTDRIDKGRKKIRRIQVWSKTETYYYVQAGATGRIVLDTEAELNPRPHVVVKKDGKKYAGKSYGFIPFWKMQNNRKEVSGLKPIKPLIDDYDLHACSLSNNLKDFDRPLYAIKGFDGDDVDELFINIGTKKTVMTSEEGGIDVKTVDIPYEARKTKLEIDEKNIYKFGMGLNTSGLKDSTSTTNIQIKMLYTLLDLKANKMETQLKKLLKKLIKVVLDEVNNEQHTAYQMSDIKFEFTRKIMTNETENISNEKTKADTKAVEINTLLNLATFIDDETLLRLICEQLDVDYEEIKDKVEKMNAEKEAEEAKKALESIIPEDETIDAPVIEE